MTIYNRCAKNGKKKKKNYLRKTKIYIIKIYCLMVCRKLCFFLYMDTKQKRKDREEKTTDLFFFSHSLVDNRL